MGKGVLTKTFNLVLFVYLVFVDSVSFLFEPRPKRNTPWNMLYDSSPSLAVVLGILLILVMLIWGAALVRIFWNRWIVDVFKVREITYDESMALVLMLAILAG